LTTIYDDEISEIRKNIKTLLHNVTFFLKKESDSYLTTRINQCILDREYNFMGNQVKFLRNALTRQPEKIILDRLVYHDYQDNCTTFTNDPVIIEKETIKHY